MSSRPAARGLVSAGDVHGVAVVGGGFGGVAAAREVAGAGNHAVLLEARDRFGGLTHTRTWHDEVTELGAAWVHYRRPFVRGELERVGVTVRAVPKADSSCFSDGPGLGLIGADEQREHDVARHRFHGAPIGQLVFAGADVARGRVGRIDRPIGTGVRAGREIRPYLKSSWPITAGEGGRR